MKEWVKGTFRLQNITLRPLLDQVLVAARLFEEIKFSHVKIIFKSGSRWVVKTGFVESYWIAAS